MVKQVIVIRRDLNMRKGKIAAQVAHAAMKFFTDKVTAGTRRKDVLVSLNEDQLSWLFDLNTKIVVAVDTEQELKDLIQKGEEAGITVGAIVDAGKTEFKGVPTLTCAAFGPNKAEEVDKITGHLKLI